MPGLSIKKFKLMLKVGFVKNPLMVRWGASVTAGYPKIFMYHRFCAVGKTIWGGISQDEFAWQVEKLSAQCEVITFGDFLLRKRTNSSIKNCAIITVDDGYRDFYLYAYPVLKQTGVPATLFVTSDFIHKKIWLWPDKLKHIVRNLEPGKYPYKFGQDFFVINAYDDKHRLSSWLELSSFCTKQSVVERDRFIGSLSLAMDIEVPEFPGPEYLACSWGELREMQSAGIEIGSHTLTHPVLSRIPADAMVREVHDSKHEIEKMIGKSIISFCYPNGGKLDINEEVVKAVEGAGYLGAAHGNPPRDWEPFLVPRMGADDNRMEFVWRLSGMEYLVARFKQLL